ERARELQQTAARLVDRAAAGGAGQVDHAVGGLARAGVNQFAGERARVRAAEADRAGGGAARDAEIAAGRVAPGAGDDIVEGADRERAIGDGRRARVGVRA